MDEAGSEDEMNYLHICPAKCVLSPVKAQEGHEGAGSVEAVLACCLGDGWHCGWIGTGRRVGNGWREEWTVKEY